MNKHLFLSSLLFITVVLFSTAQTQRMVMYEGFSNASCAPCAAQNPAVNALLKANPTKVVALKYQCNWPGTDPMNAQTQTWVGPRVSYYGITGVPSTRVDGTGTSISQTVINNRYATPSPFMMEINHTFNAAQDSAFIQVRIEAAQNFTGNQLVLHTAMVEKVISFTTPPGTNGEKVFYNVMRQMYPNANGTPLPSNWTNGQVEIYNFAVKIPSYIYQFNQIAFVAFIQSNADKVVHQAAKTILNKHMSILYHNIPQAPGCYDQFTFEITVINQGKTTITSIDIEYGIVGQTPQVVNWTGSVAYGQTANITLPSIPISGTTTVFAEIKNLNGGPPDSNDGARVEGQIATISSYTPIPVTQTFTSTTFPPTNWATVSDDDLKWERSTASGFGNAPAGSARILFYSSPQGAVDMLYMEGLNLTTTGNLQLTFSLAHARYSAQYSDNLKVDISTNCGASWTTVYNKSGADLATVTSFVTSSFTPTASQWRKETIDLSGYTSQNEVLIRFNAISGYGNNLYIDDINISTPATIDESAINGYVALYPNPVSDMVSIEMLLPESTDINIKVYDNTGKIVGSIQSGKLTQGNHTINLDATSWAAGLYHAVITTEKGTTTKKFIKQ